MSSGFRFAVAASLMLAWLLLVETAIDPTAALQGEWVARTVQLIGLTGSANDQLRFIFRDRRLTIRGKPGDGTSTECVYRIDATQSPKHLDFTAAPDEQPMLAIYEVAGDELTICFPKLAKGGVCEKRPTKFSGGFFSGTVLMVFSRCNQNKNAEQSLAAESR